MEKIKEFIINFNPIKLAASIAKNFLFHSITILKNVKGGIDAWNAQDFKTSGHKFGEILFIVTQ